MTLKIVPWRIRCFMELREQFQKQYKERDSQ